MIYAPLPITEKSIAGILTNPDNEVRLVAQIDGEIVGVGALVLEKSELRACYVAPGASRTRCFPYQVLPVPGASRKGVDAALVREIGRIARKHGLAYLRLDSSVTAEPFYRALGYKMSERGEHVRRSGLRMACVKTEKPLVPR